MEMETSGARLGKVLGAHGIGLFLRPPVLLQRRQESGCFATTDRVRAVGEHAAVSQCPPPARKVEVWSLEEVDKLTADRT